MKKFTGVSLIAFCSIASVSAAETESYYQYEIISTAIDGDTHHGPFATALTATGDSYALKATTARLDQDLDHGLAYTFNQRCFYSDDVCALRYNGGEDSSSLSYENAYKQWRNMTFDINNNEEEAQQYFVAETSDAGLITGFGSDTDVQITDLVETTLDGTFAVGYGSATYDSDNARDFVRRAFIMDYTSSEQQIALLPDDFAEDDDDVDDDYGGFSSAYKMKEVTYNDGTEKTLIVGQASKSFAGGDTDYFDNCYTDGDTDNRYTLNTMVQCPGFDTQAWAWEYDSSSSDTELYGFALATQWLDDNETRSGSDITYSATALDINASGIAVGVSSFEYNDDDEGGRQRAIIMTPDDNGNYAEPTELTKATSGVSEQEDSIRNTWANAITDDNIVLGNRKWASSRGNNYATEFFIYNLGEDSIDFPLYDRKVQSTKQRLEEETVTWKGANSQGYAMNESGLVVGKADAYDQTGPVEGSTPRTQSAFLYDSNTESETYDESWFLEDLLCSEDADGVITHPLIRLESATVINDDGIILAQGYLYDSIEDYQIAVGATSIVVKLTPSSDTSLTPNDSPNCWESEALSDTDSNYERQGAAAFWIWILFLPILMLRLLKLRK